MLVCACARERALLSFFFYHLRREAQSFLVTVEVAISLRFARTITSAHYTSALPFAGAEPLHPVSHSLLYLIPLPLALGILNT